VTAKKRAEKILVKCVGSNIRSSGAPPGRRGLSVMKADTTEEPGIAENQGPLRLVQNQVIMVFRPKAVGFDAQLPGHAEMDPDPVAAGKLEEHLFSPGERAEKTPAG
jgi:hypothetical protein